MAASPRILKVDGKIQASQVTDTSGSFLVGSSGSLSGSNTTIYAQIPAMMSGAYVKGCTFAVSRNDNNEMYSAFAISMSSQNPAGNPWIYWTPGVDILAPPYLIVQKMGRSGSEGAGDVGQWLYSDVRILPNFAHQEPMRGVEPFLLLSGTFEISSGSAWINAANVYPRDLKMAVGSSAPNVRSVGNDISFYVSGTMAGKNVGGTSVFGGDLVVSGTVFNSLGAPVSAILNVRTISNNANVLITDQIILVDASAAHVTASLPSAAVAATKAVYIKKIDATGNSAVIRPNGVDTIDGSASENKIAVQYNLIQIVASGSGWWIL